MKLDSGFQAFLVRDITRLDLQPIANSSDPAPGPPQSTMAVIQVVDIVVILLTIWLLNITLKRKQKGPSPPGPKPLSFIGNLLDMPRSTDRPWETFCEWGGRWG